MYVQWPQIQSTCSLWMRLLTCPITLPIPQALGAAAQGYKPRNVVEESSPFGCCAELYDIYLRDLAGGALASVTSLRIYVPSGVLIVYSWLLLLVFPTCLCQIILCRWPLSRRRRVNRLQLAALAASPSSCQTDNQCTPSRLGALLSHGLCGHVSMHLFRSLSCPFEAQERQFCLFHTLNMACGRQVFTGPSLQCILSFFQSYKDQF